MLKPLFDIAALIKPLCDGEVILTPNRRLAAKIIQAYGVWQHQSGNKAWCQPSVYSIDDYAQQRWQQASLCGGVAPSWLLTPHQLLLLWEQAITANDSFYVSRPAATAKVAADAFNHLERWQINIEDYADAFEDQLDSRAFVAWRDDFTRRCQRLSAFTPAMLINRIIAYYQDQDRRECEETTVWLVGFDVLTPQYQSLTECLFSDIKHYRAELRANTVTALHCDGEEQQWLLCANHFKAALEQNPEQRLGLIIQDLNQNKERIERCFMQVFEPHMLNNLHHRSTLPFNISAGNNLRSAPLVNTVVDILSLLGEVITAASLKRLLQSPFWQDSKNSAGVHRLLNRFTADSRVEYSRFELQQQLMVTDEREPTLLLIQLLQIDTQTGGSRSPSQWLKVFEQALQTSGWPGPRPIDSVEFQQIEAFHQSLSMFQQLDDVSGDIGFNRALELLEAQLRLDVFQQQSFDGPIHILGALEGAGLSFDQLWVAGVDDAVWPAQARPNPYIPIALQIEHGMPHANASRELAVSENLTRSYLCASDQIICSYGSGDEAPRLSMLFEQVLTQPTLTVAQWSGSDTSLVALSERIASHAVQYCRDDIAPPVAVAGNVKGGSAIFRDQAACPFRAYAQHRLRTRTSDTVSEGFSILERGNGLHDALEYIWSRLSGLEALLAKTADELNDLVVEAAAFSVQGVLARKARAPISRITALEHRRLERVLGQWLALESQRSAFTVEALEHEQQLVFADLPLTLRMDRVDRLGEDEIAIIDYKSGTVSVNNWLDERLKEPQLPLYVCALAGQSPRVSTVLYGQVKLADCSYKGLSEHQSIVGIKLDNKAKAVRAQAEDFTGLVESWQRNLTALAEGFLRGEATVNPKQNDTCQYCALQRLCRIAEVSAL